MVSAERVMFISCLILSRTSDESIMRSDSVVLLKCLYSVVLASCATHVLVGDVYEYDRFYLSANHWIILMCSFWYTISLAHSSFSLGCVKMLSCSSPAKYKESTKSEAWRFLVHLLTGSCAFSLIKLRV